VASITDILSYVPLTEAVQTIKGGLPRVLPDVFWDLSEDLPGTKGRLIEYQGQRQVARVTPAGAPPRPVQQLPLDDKALIMLSSDEEITFAEELQNVLMKWEQYEPQQNWAERQLAYQGEAFRMKFENLETAAVLQTVANGTLYFDADGNLLPTSSGAVLSVPQGVPTNNTGTLNGLLTGSFATSTFDIIGFLTQKLKPRALTDTNYPTRTAIYGANIPGYMANNQYVQRAWAFQQEYASYYQNTGDIKEGFCGFKWIPAAEAYYVDQNQNSQLIFPPDQITFMPEITKAVWTFYRGSTQVPTQFGAIMPTAEATLKSFSEIFGRYRYAYVPVNNTFKIVEVGGTKFLPRMKVPGSTYLLNTTA